MSYFSELQKSNAPCVIEGIINIEQLPVVDLNTTHMSFEQVIKAHEKGLLGSTELPSNQYD